MSSVSTRSPRRTRKRQATREAISAIATRMFIERGFDNVTVGEIAEAADVARMTVFNYFPRKEDLFFDQETEARALLREALLNRDAAVPPLAALQQLAHRLVAERRPFARFSAQSAAFFQAIEKSEALRSRARGIRDEVAADLAGDLAESARASGVTLLEAEPDSRLAAHLLLACSTVAYGEAHMIFARFADPDQAAAMFLSIMDKGFAGVRAALAGTVFS
jgi:AcrR family transcriptional regulator